MTFRTLLLVSAGLLSFAGTAYAEDYTCWPVTYPLQAQAGNYWTRERLARAVPDEPVADVRSAKVMQGEKRADVTKIPYKYGGKLFYTRDGVDRMASAQFAEKEDIILAAAHSMYIGGKKAQNIVFFRGYDDGGGTKFEVDRAAVTTAWTAVSSDPMSYKRTQSDYAVLHAKAKSDTGFFPITTEADFTQTIVMGYPSAFDGGKRMYQGETAKWARAGDTYVARPPVLGPGSSGGAWFVGDEESGYSLVSVVSGGSSTEMQGAVMTEKTMGLIGYVAGGCQ